MSFVDLHAGRALAKRGDMQVMLPRLDVPVSILEWELFLPGQLLREPIDGNVIAARAERTTSASMLVSFGGLGTGTGGGTGGGYYLERRRRSASPSGRARSRPRHRPHRRRHPRRDRHRHRRRVGCRRQQRRRLLRRARRPSSNSLVVTARSPGSTPRAGRSPTTSGRDAWISRCRSARYRDRDGQRRGAARGRPLVRRRQVERRGREAGKVQQAPSANVMNMQRRVAGVLPVRVDVPRSGIQDRFVRPLVLDEDTHVSCVQDALISARTGNGGFGGIGF